MFVCGSMKKQVPICLMDMLLEKLTLGCTLTIQPRLYRLWSREEKTWVSLAIPGSLSQHHMLRVIISQKKPFANSALPTLQRTKLFYKNLNNNKKQYFLSKLVAFPTMVFCGKIIADINNNFEKTLVALPLAKSRWSKSKQVFFEVGPLYLW